MSNPEQQYTRLDNAFAQFLLQRSALTGQHQQRFKQLVLTLSKQQQEGHNCICVTDEDSALLLASGCVAEVTGKLEELPAKPLLLEGRNLYLQRYWFYETRLAEQLRQKIQINISQPQLNTLIERYFPLPVDQIDWQREAAINTLGLGFSVITGGPGTGKTTTVVKILGLIQDLSEPKLLIALAAPTGKAAMRLQESIASHIHSLPCSETVKHAIPTSVTTIHRLLGAKADSPFFKHHADRPLPYDLIVVDEASMVDLALMSKLLDALKPSCRLILLGDKDQLASVESGAVLADITGALPLQTQELKHAYRFNQPIKDLSIAVNEQQAEQAWDYFQQNSETLGLVNENLIDAIVQRQIDYLSKIKSRTEVAEIFRAFNRFQVLCANRQGKNSVSDINYRVEQALAAAGHISISGQWYLGRPIMVTRNHPGMHLYNGDIGLCLPDPEQENRLKVFFQMPDGSVKKLLPSRLPDCETVFAMTIHKSQGSEFDNVLIVLPEQINPILTKELIYTAITRAKKSVKLCSGQAVFLQAVKQRVQRFGGLSEKLSAALT